MTGTTAFRELAKSPTAGGIGIELRSTTDPFRVNVLNGIQKLKRAFHLQKYKVCSKFWERSRDATGNSLRKSIYGYGWAANQEQPNKSGIEDPLDALRYDCLFYHWHDTEIKPARYMLNIPKSGTNRPKRQRYF